MTHISPLAETLRTYAFAYTAMHDFAVSDRIMADDYVLHMGPLAIRGRRESYQPATMRQYEQFPGLGFTVHRLISNGDRAALHFTEHGLSVRAGREAAWQGVSLYRWDRRVLTECRVEQDYYARRRQLTDGRPHDVLPPGRDPWTGSDLPADSAREERVRAWLATPGWRSTPGVRHDDGSEQPALEDEHTHILDLFGAGDAVAFHVRVVGAYVGGLASDPGTHSELAGRPADLYATGIVDVAADGGLTGTVVTDRHSLLRRLRDRG